MTASEEPILSRLDRLDNMLRQLEEIKGSGRSSSSYPSTPSSGTSQVSFTDLSPKSMEKRCRPMESVMVEVGMKGSLIDRLQFVEDRMLKLCTQVEEEIAEEERRMNAVNGAAEEGMRSPVGKKKGIKGLVRKIMKGNHHNRSHNQASHSPLGVNT